MPKKNMTIEDLAKLMDKRFDAVDKKIEDTVEKGVESLAVMVKRGFDEQTERTSQLKKQMLVHDFKMTEMVHKADYFKLEERVEVLEKKVLRNH